MKKTMSYSILFMLVFSLSVFVACKGKESTTSGPPTVATITLAAELDTAVTGSTEVGGYDVIVTLPAGVEVPTLPSGQPASSAVAGSGAGTNSAVAATYTAATGSTPGKVRVSVAKGGDLGHGQFITISTNIIPGYCPQLQDFPAPTFTASGFDTATQSTVNVTGKVTITETVSMNGTCEGTTGTGTSSGTDTVTDTNTDTGTGSSPAPAACTYTYSEWTACDSTGTQTRTVATQTPDGCTGTPELSQSCTPPDTGTETNYP